MPASRSVRCRGFVTAVQDAQMLLLPPDCCSVGVARLAGQCAATGRCLLMLPPDCWGPQVDLSCFVQCNALLQVSFALCSSLMSWTTGACGS